MKKIIYFFVIGLMSLITMSCEDHFSYDSGNNFMPITYEAKIPDEVGTVSSTLLILGVEGLVFDEIEKSDWKIITRETTLFRGEEPLVLSENRFALEYDGAELLKIPTNYEDIPVTFGNTTVTYEYMGKPVELVAGDGLNISIKIEEEKRVETPFFAQYGKIIYTLMVGYIPVKIHEQTLFVYSDDEIIEEWKKELEESDYGNTGDTDTDSDTDTE